MNSDDKTVLGLGVKLIRIMIGAPGDLKEEVEIVRQEIAEWNNQHAEEKKVILISKHWTTSSHPRLGRTGQKTINKQLVENSDVLVAMFWNRLGTPTGDAPSGTAEEINEFYQAGKPVKVYFSNLMVNRALLMSEVGREEADRLEKFKEDVRRVGLYDEYSNFEEFKTKIKRHLHLEVLSIISENFIAEKRRSMLTSNLSLDDFSDVDDTNWEERAKNISYWIIQDAVRRSEKQISFRVTDIIKIYQVVLHNLGITVYKVNSGALITSLVIDCINHRILDERGLRNRNSLTSSYLYSRLYPHALTRFTNGKKGNGSEVYYGFSTVPSSKNQYEKCISDLLKMGIDDKILHKVRSLRKDGTEISLKLSSDILALVEEVNPKEFRKQVELK